MRLISGDFCSYLNMAKKIMQYFSTEKENLDNQIYIDKPLTFYELPVSLLYLKGNCHAGRITAEFRLPPLSCKSSPMQISQRLGKRNPNTLPG